MANIRPKEGKKGRTWEARVRLAGAPPLSRTFPTYQEAVAWVREKEGAITRGANPMTTADKVLVF